MSAVHFLRGRICLVNLQHLEINTSLENICKWLLFLNLLCRNMEASV